MPDSGTVSAHHAQTAQWRRDRLFSRLDRFSALMVIEAPPGFGKTFLVDRWAAALGDTQVHWFNGERLDLQGINAIPDSSADAPAVVVIDGFDGVPRSEVSSAILNLIGRERRLRVLVTGRSVEHLRREAWRRGVDVAALGAGDLVASPAELLALAQDWGRDLSQEMADDLHRVTGGWPLVARLVLEADHGSGALTLDSAARYLSATVVDLLDAESRQMAEALALPEEITAAHLRAVVSQLPETAQARADERAAVASLEAAQILRRQDVGWTMLPVLRHAFKVASLGLTGTEERWWHRQFVEALREDDEPANVAHVLRHARAAEDWATLHDLWTRYGNSLLDSCREAMVAAYRDPPPVALTRWPYLTVPAAVVAWATQDRPYSDVQRALYHSLRPLAAAYHLGQGEGGDLEDRLSGAAAAMVTYRVEGNFQKGLDLGERVEVQVGPQVADGPTPMRYAWFLMQWSMTTLASGDWQAAAQRFSHCFDVAHDTRSAEFIAANSAASAAMIAAFEGSTGDARYWLRQYRHFADPQSWAHPHVSQAAHLAEAILAMDRLDAASAEWHLDAAGELSTDLELWPCNLYVRTQHALHFGDPIGMLTQLDQARTVHAVQASVDGAAQRMLHRTEADLLLSLGEVNRAAARVGGGTAAWLATSRARLHLITGDVERARYWASAAAWEPANTARDRLDRLMIQAVAAEQQHLTEQADQSFRQAVALAAQIGTLRAYPLVPRDALETLLARSPGLLNGADLERVRAARQPHPQAASLITLSEREQVVLRQMSRFANIRRIAEALTVSPNTVKKQVVAVYAKLGVHDRESALLEAHRLGLLSN